MKPDLTRDPFGHRRLERFVGENVFLREVNVPGGIIEKAVLVPGRSLEIPDVRDDENQREDAEDPQEPFIVPDRRQPVLCLTAARKVGREEEKKAAEER